jgi:hypothetical protein
MKKLCLIVSLLVFSGLYAKAQYQHSIGISIGMPAGIVYKTFTNDTRAWEIAAGTNREFGGFTALYEIHKPLIKNTLWYFGPGAMVGAWVGRIHSFGPLVSVQGGLGMEFQPDIPLAFSLDFRPNILLFGDAPDFSNGIFFYTGQVAVRYIF